MKKTRVRCNLHTSHTENNISSNRISCKIGNKEIGHASVHFYKEPKSYPSIGITIPANTAIYGETEVDKVYRGKGYGTEMLKLAEQKSTEEQMERIWVPSVDNPHFFVKNGFYYTGKQRIFEKDLAGKPLTHSQRRRTEKYISIFKKYIKED